MKRWLKFLFRGIGSLLVAAVYAFATVGIALGVVCVIDRTNIARKCLKAFAPYSSSLPWVLCIVAFVLFLCIPGVLTTLLSILRRIKKIGPVELFPAEDPEEEDLIVSELPNKLTGSIQKRGKAGSPQLIRAMKRVLQPDQQKALLSKLSSLKSMKQLLLSLHAGRFGANVMERKCRIKNNELFFDAHLLRGDDHILVRLLSGSSNDAPKVAKGIREIVEISPSCPFVFHLLFYTSRKDKSMNVDFGEIRKIIFNISNIRLFFYSVSDDNSVKPLEEIP